MMSKILVVIDGSKHAGTATAYLINRAKNGHRDDLLVVNVDPEEPAMSASPLANLTSLHGGTIRVIADMAGPWLNEAGIACEFRDEVGDVAEVVTALARQGGIQEVVIVSDDDTPIIRILNRFRWFRRGLALEILSARTGLPVSLVARQTTGRVN